MAEIILHGSNDSYQFDPEDLETIIGKGGMGVVFKGFALEKNTTVAIKVLYREITSNISNIERERQSASIHIQHQNIVKMLDFIELDGIYHIISEFLVGQTLHSLIEEKAKSGTRLNHKESYAIIKSVLEGLDTLHKSGVIHRDIDPSNIFICENGTVKIMDFGIAKISDGKRKSLTGIGTILGKPHYSPPEQIRGESAKVSPASDLYSLAITYYEMMTGQPPFNATNEYDLMKMQIEQPLPNNSFISPSLFRLLKRATDKNPLNRYQSGQAFLEALDKSFLPEVDEVHASPIYKATTLILGILFLISVFFCIFIYSNNQAQIDELNSTNLELRLSNEQLKEEVRVWRIKNEALNTKYQNALILRFDIPIKVTDIQFANRNANQALLTRYGDKLYANKLIYLHSRISFINLSNKRTLKLMIKLLEPNGAISRGTDSPPGYSYAVTVYNDSGIGSRMSNYELPLGWGNTNGGSYSPGNYTFQIFTEDGKLIESRGFTVY